MSDYITEAEALADIEECFYDDYSFEPYSVLDKRIYLRAKSSFPKTAKGKFVITQSTRKNRHLISKLFLVDRNKTKSFWWSHDVRFAMLFNSKKAALVIANKYKYNNVQVVEIK